MNTNKEKSAKESDKNKTTASAKDCAKLYFELAKQYQQNNKVAEAIAEYNKAIELEPENPEFYFQRGLSYLTTKEIEKFLEDFSTAKKIDPDGEFSKKVDQFYQDFFLTPNYHLYINYLLSA